VAKFEYRQNILDSDRIGWLLVKLATPAFFGMFVQTIYNVINTIFIGHFVGTMAIAGLSIVFPLQMLAMGMSMMVGMGGASLISRCLGVRRIDDAERTVGNGISLAVIVSLVVTIIVLPFTDFWLRLIGASDAVLPYASIYLKIIMGATLINVLAMTLLNFSRAEGNSRVGMIAMIMGAVLSIILDAIFIIPLKMGVTGAALATVISQFASFLYLLSYYFFGKSYLKIKLQNLRLDISILKQMLAIGISSFVQTVASSISAMLLLNLVVSYGGDIALGAFGIIQRVMMFMTMPAMVFGGQGLQPVLGFNYGARRYKLALKAIRISATVSSILSLTAFMIVYFVPGPIIRIFTSDPELISMGIYASRLVFISLPFMGLVMIGQTIFMAIGKALQAFILSIVRPVLFLIPAVILLSRYFQLSGVFLAFPVSDILTLMLVAALASQVIRQFSSAAEKLAAEPVLSGHMAKSEDKHR